MAKIDEIKEILNTLRILLSIFMGVLVLLIGKLFSKYEAMQFDDTFWLLTFSGVVVIIVEVLVVYMISKKTKEIGGL